MSAKQVFQVKEVRFQYHLLFKSCFITDRTKFSTRLLNAFRTAVSNEILLLYFQYCVQYSSSQFSTGSSAENAFFKQDQTKYTGTAFNTESAYFSTLRTGLVQLLYSFGIYFVPESRSERRTLYPKVFADLNYLFKYWRQQSVFLDELCSNQNQQSRNLYPSYLAMCGCLLALKAWNGRLNMIAD